MESGNDPSVGTSGNIAESEDLERIPSQQDEKGDEEDDLSHFARFLGLELVDNIRLTDIALPPRQNLSRAWLFYLVKVTEKQFPSQRITQIERFTKVLAHIKQVCEGCAHIPARKARQMQQYVTRDIKKYLDKLRSRAVSSRNQVTDAEKFLQSTRTINLLDPLLRFRNVDEVGAGSSDNQAREPLADVLTCQPQLIRWVQGSKMIRQVIPTLEVRPSSIPQLAADNVWGLYTKYDLPAGVVVAVYGGSVIWDRRYARDVLRGEFAMDDHLQKVGDQNGGHSVDGRISDDFPLSYYLDNGLCASLINDCEGSGKNHNVKAVTLTGCFQHPYNSPNANVSEILALVTMEAIPGRTELLRHYGSQFRGLHHRVTDEERRTDLERARTMPPPPPPTHRDLQAHDNSLNYEQGVRFRLGMGSFALCNMRPGVDPTPIQYEMYKPDQLPACRVFRTADTLTLQDAANLSRCGDVGVAAEGRNLRRKTQAAPQSAQSATAAASAWRKPPTVMQTKQRTGNKNRAGGGAAHTSWIRKREWVVSPSANLHEAREKNEVLVLHCGREMP